MEKSLSLKAKIKIELLIYLDSLISRIKLIRSKMLGTSMIKCPLCGRLNTYDGICWYCGIDAAQWYYGQRTRRVIKKYHKKWKKAHYNYYINRVDKK